MAKDIKVYSTPACPHCIRAKQFLRDNNIVFEDIDVSSDTKKAQEMMDISGQMGVPVLYIDGKIIVGFDRDRIKELLQL